MTSPNADLHSHIPWLDGERFDIAIDSSAGVVDDPPQRGDALTVTDRRIVKLSSSSGERTLTVAPLANVAAVEVVEVSRPRQRLGQAVFLAVVAAALGFISWSMISVPFVSVLAGGVPALFAVYALSAWLFPDGEGALRLYVQGRAVAQPLRTAKARRDAYLVAQRLSVLLTPGPDSPAGGEHAPRVDETRPQPHDEPSAWRPRISVRRRPWSPFRERHKLPRPRPAPPASERAPKRRRQRGRAAAPDVLRTRAQRK